MKYVDLLSGIQNLLAQARHRAARSVDSILVATYWEVGRRIVVFEQKGERRAGYGEQVITRLSGDLMTRLGRGFSQRNLEQMRLFYLRWPGSLSAKKPKAQTLSAQSRGGDLAGIARHFPLSWSQYVRLLSVDSVEARKFYEVYL